MTEQQRAAVDRVQRAGAWMLLLTGFDPWPKTIGARQSGKEWIIAPDGSTARVDGGDPGDEND